LKFSVVRLIGCAIFPTPKSYGFEISCYAKVY
jgi:hypothetical protein